MPFKWKSKGRVPTDPEILETAVREICSTNGKIRTVAKKYNIDRTTLSRYVHKFKSNEIVSFVANFNSSQIFTNQEEYLLVQYLLKCADLHYGLTPIAVRKFAYIFATENNKKISAAWEKNRAATRDWLRGFMSRHGNLSLRTPEATSVGRATAFNKYTVQLFFDNLKTIMTREQITPDCIYNADETGVTTAHKPQKIIAKKGQKQVSKATSCERGSLVTVLCTISASGNTIPPFLIFPRARIQDYMTRGLPIGADAAVNPSGWMTHENFEKYLQHFVNYSRVNKDHKCLLILDNHDSHISPKGLNICKENGVMLLTIPPHTSHKLQPLDTNVFGPFKRFYNEAADNWMVNNPAQLISLKEIPELVASAYVRAFTPANIVGGFSHTGICPYNPAVFSDSDFTSSEITDRPDPSEALHPTENLLLAVPSTSQNNPNAFVSPEVIRPFPKALPRKKKAGRKCGKTRILTDTPEKDLIEKEFEERAKKKEEQNKKKEERVERLKKNC